MSDRVASSSGTGHDAADPATLRGAWKFARQKRGLNLWASFWTVYYVWKWRGV